MKWIRDFMSYPFFILAYNFIAVGEIIIGKKLHVECHEETERCRWCGDNKPDDVEE